MSITYSSYLNLDKLLNLQTGSQSSINNDELLFITIHQSCELWFKLLLDTLESARNFLNQHSLYAAIDKFKRCRMIIKNLVHQMDIISTLSPMEFNRYRNLLGNSSGLQSFQFRELEFILGKKQEKILDWFQKETWVYQRLVNRIKEQTVNEALKLFLYRLANTSCDNPEIDISNYNDMLITLYKTQANIAILLDHVLDIDEGLQEWRYRHVKLVERVIGTKQGTGGTQGLEFLKMGLFKPFFPELWEIRSFL